MMKNTIGFFLLAGLLGLSFAKPMPQEAKEMKDETTAMPMPVSITQHMLFRVIEKEESFLLTKNPLLLLNNFDKRSQRFAPFSVYLFTITIESPSTF